MCPCKHILLHDLQDCGHAASHDDELFDQRPSHQAAASQPSQRVVLAYDERMTLHVEGQGSSHPERPDRIRAVMARLTASGLIGLPVPKPFCVFMPASLAASSS